jgi:hypothetical protein
VLISLSYNLSYWGRWDQEHYFWGQLRELIPGHGGIYRSSQAIWEAEIGKIQFQADLGKKKKKKVCETSPPPSGKKLGVVAHACYSSKTWAKSKTLSPNKPEQKRTWVVAQEIGVCLANIKSWV